MSKIKIGIIGGGIDSAVGRAHISALRLSFKFELKAYCLSQDPEINRRSEMEYGFDGKLYSNIEELLTKEKNNIEAVLILTPTQLHYEHIEKCFAYNIPVISEKALTTSSHTAEILKEKIENENQFLIVTYNYLGYPLLRELKHLINIENLLGKINHIQIEMPQEGFVKINENGDPIQPQLWRLKDYELPTLSLDLGVHVHSIVKYLTNEKPLSTVASSQSYGNFSSIKDNISCLVQYSNNLTCNFWYSKVAVGYRNGLNVRIFGSLGAAEWFQEHPENLYMSNTYGHKWILNRGSSGLKVCNQERYTRFKAGHPAGFIEAFANYYEDIFMNLENYKENNKAELIECYGVHEAVEGLRLLEAMERSIHSKKWEDV